MNIATIADAQYEARSMAEDGLFSQSIHTLSDGVREIRSEAIALLSQETPDARAASRFLERITVPRIHDEAVALLDGGDVRGALTYARQQLSELRRRAARVTCIPIVMKDSVVDFITYLGEEGHEVPVCARHAALSPVTWE